MGDGIDLANCASTDCDERALAAIAVGLGAADVAGWSTPERRLAKQATRVPDSLIGDVRESILAGADPLGESLCALRSPAQRRSRGATFTPAAIVGAMLDWAQGHGTPARVIDPGTGSGRFLLEAARRFPAALLSGVEVDPLTALLARANLAACGLADRARIELADYRSYSPRPCGGRTLFIGNPPYVRHHQLGTKWKRWLVEEAGKRRLHASQLAGLHVHFYLATVAKAAPGDFGSFVTAAEWLDVNYGQLVRDLFLGPLGGRRIVVIEPAAMPFPDAATTAAITQFEIHSRPKTIQLKRVASLDQLHERNGHRVIRRARLAAAPRWSHMARVPDRAAAGFVQLGELCRVHRGQATGANKVWIAGDDADDLPAAVLFPSITRARELFAAGRVLDSASHLRRVIDLPAELDALGDGERTAIERFLRRARRRGVHRGYLATKRRPWWSVRLREPAPILATYMARRPPAFVLNKAAARHLNIAHGLYPREALTQRQLRRLTDYLSASVNVASGRTYAGGLTKFEPREMERLIVPGPELLRQGLEA